MTNFLNLVSIISIGLMIGTEFAVSVFINPILLQLDEPARSEAVRLFGRKLGKVMPYWYCGNMVLLVAEAVALRNHAGVGLLGAAVAFWAAAIVLSIVVLVPINNRLVQQGSGLSLEGAHDQHKRWDAMHRVRVLALGAAMVLLLLAVN